MSLQTPTHHTEDWSRSSFFDIDSEMVKDLNLQSDAEDSDNEDICNDDKLSLNNFDSTFYSIDNEEIDVATFTDNPFMNDIMQSMINQFAKLMRSGELPATFMDKMYKNPEEIVAFIQENHTTIGNELCDKLDPETRPTLNDIIANNIIPNKYYPHIKIISKPPVQNAQITPITPTDTDSNINEKNSLEKSENIIETAAETEIKTNENENKNKTQRKYSISYITEKDQQIHKLQIEIANMKTKVTEYTNNEFAKDNKINELIGIINEMKTNENNKNQLLNFQISHCDFSVENTNYFKYKNEINSIQNEYNKILNNKKEMENKYNELENKYSECMGQLKTMERSKIALLSAFNGEMDRMRANIKKYNCLTPRNKINALSLSI